METINSTIQFKLITENQFETIIDGTITPLRVGRVPNPHKQNKREIGVVGLHIDGSGKTVNWAAFGKNGYNSITALAHRAVSAYYEYANRKSSPKYAIQIIENDDSLMLRGVIDGFNVLVGHVSKLKMIEIAQNEVQTFAREMVEAARYAQVSESLNFNIAQVAPPAPPKSKRK